MKGVSHFLQETHGPQLSDNIVSFLNKKLDWNFHARTYAFYLPIIVYCFYPFYI